ncbi:MAG: hypothetical protein Q9200_004781, partial [Gallowayella weberi]
MRRSSIPFLCALLLASQATFAQQFVPRGDIEYRDGTKIHRREGYTCQPASPGVSQEAVFRDACNQNPGSDYNTCFNTLVQYAQNSAASICARYYTIYNDCLVTHDYSETTCNDSRIGYVYCSNYTIQAYAYCGCYFAEPFQIYNCANVELSINRNVDRQQSAQVPSNAILSSALLSGPVAPSSATLIGIPLSVPSNVPIFSPRQSIEVHSSEWLCPTGA